MAIDLKTEAYEASSELFSFKDLRRGVIEHGRICYIEGYKKHAELFCSFLVQNGYFSSEELNKVITEYDAYLNDKPAVSILTCEDLLKKSKIVKWENSKPRKAECLNLAQKDIIMHYCDSLVGEKNKLRIKKSRQKGVTTALCLIAYLEAMNNKAVLYIGYEDPFKKLGLKQNHMLQYKDANLKTPLIANRYDLIIVEEMSTVGEWYASYNDAVKSIEMCLAEDGKMVIVGTPSSPDRPEYSKSKKYFKSDSPDMFTYSTGPVDDIEDKLKHFPEMKNELMGDFID